MMGRVLTKLWAWLGDPCPPMPWRYERDAFAAHARATQLFLRADSLINGPRCADYGEPWVNMGRTAALWTAYLGAKLNAPITAKDAAIFHALGKLSREANLSKPDNMDDAAGYIGVAAMIQAWNERAKA